ncbi:MAG: hypothetical protein NT175_03225 [Bacteroidetes bacterium]|nr:hypothetical protein [Bacteroidota bacterium]
MDNIKYGQGCRGRPRDSLYHANGPPEDPLDHCKGPPGDVPERANGPPLNALGRAGPGILYSYFREPAGCLASGNARGMPGRERSAFNVQGNEPVHLNNQL